MLARSAQPDGSVGLFSGELHAPKTFRYKLIAFIAFELPRWRDDGNRPEERAETALTEQLCRYLASVAHQSDGLDCVQFVHESRDKRRRARALDIAVAPSTKDIVIEERRYGVYDTIMCIECKRLPTPRGTERDEREYVFSHYGVRGGIQRFKSGDHAAEHTHALMIGYVQTDTTHEWQPRVCKWVSDLAAHGEPGWSDKDLLRIESEDAAGRIMKLRSNHEREGELAPIELCHLWVMMN